MDQGKKFVFLIIMTVILTTGCLVATSSRPDWVHNINWQGDVPGNTHDIEDSIWLQVSPYKAEYDNVNITAKSDNSGLSLRITAFSNAAEYPDIYDFIYEDEILTRTGYLLEAIRPVDRDSAIAAAMRDKEVMDAGITGAPTVKRILPDTSKKYYAPKTLLSVTWSGTSALVDPAEMKVVKVWKSSGME